jgi:hypothetical protein
MLNASNGTNSGGAVKRGAVLLTLVVLLSGWSGSAQSGPVEQAFAAVPFRDWVAAGPKTELPWRVHITPPKLTLHQRLAVQAEISLDGSELVKHCCDGQASALIEITDSQGHAYRNLVTKDLKDAQPAMHEYTVDMSWQIFVLPGDYQAVIAFYYSGREPHSLSVQKIHVEPLKHDPLPESWRDLPAIEFCDPQAEGLDEFLVPNIEGRLHLPARPARQVRIEILGNLTPYPSERGKPNQYTERLAVFLPILRTLAQLEIENGSVDESVLDLTRRSVIFDQPDIKNGQVSWTSLKEPLSASSTAAVDVHDLQQEEHLGEFLRDEMTRRLDEAASDKIARVFIIVSGAMDLGPGSLEITPPNGVKFAAFYLKCNFLQRLTGPPRSFSVMPIEPSEQAIERSGPDGMAKVLKGLQPRILPVDSAQDVRLALATMLNEISRM